MSAGAWRRPGTVIVMSERPPSSGGPPAPTDVTQLTYLLPPEVDPVCNAAVDPLEIAAALGGGGSEQSGGADQVRPSRSVHPGRGALRHSLRTGRARARPAQPPRPGRGARTWPSGSSSSCPPSASPSPPAPCTWFCPGGPFPWPSPSAGPSARPRPVRPSLSSTAVRIRPRPYCPSLRAHRSRRHGGGAGGHHLGPRQFGSAVAHHHLVLPLRGLAHRLVGVQGSRHPSPSPWLRHCSSRSPI